MYRYVAMMKTTVHTQQAMRTAEQPGSYFNRVTMRAPFAGPFDARAIYQQVSPDYEGCLYRPVSIDFASIREISPGVVEWVRVISNGD